jgi:hypothetical protein
MKKILSGLTTLTVIIGLFGCGKAEEKTPVYKFSAKVNGTSWATDMVVPSTTPSEAIYVDYLNYNTSGKYIYCIVKNPKNNNIIKFSITIPSYVNAVGTYTTSSGYFVPSYEIANSDALTSESVSGSFEITKFSYDPNSYKITAFSGKFSFKQTAKHWDDIARTFDVTGGEVNNLTNN